jgi:AraC-like DNA-binding protein
MIRELLPVGHPTIDRAAQRLGTSVRTLQRRLHNAGLSYSELLDEVRCDAACRLLTNPRARSTVRRRLNRFRGRAGAQSHPEGVGGGHRDPAAPARHAAARARRAEEVIAGAAAAGPETDRDNIFSKELDRSITRLGIDVIETPYRNPQANSICERVIGSMRRECLDYMIPLNETHLRKIVKEWVAHYNQSRPHAALGPIVPDPTSGIPVATGDDRHRIADGRKVISKPIL